MSADLTLHLVQMTSSLNLDENMAVVVQAAKNAHEHGADILVLPEMFALFGSDQQQSLGRQEMDFSGPVGMVLRQLAQQYKLWIVAGTVPVLVADDDRPRARCVVLNSDGDIHCYYDKIHLFDAYVGDKQGGYRESAGYSPGSEVVCFDSPWGKIGLAVCYDLRFPELFRQLNDAGAQLVIVPSAFTFKTGQAHWEVLCRSRAIENGFFLAAVNQCGQHDEKRQTWGQSMLVDAWGNIQSLAQQPGELTVTLCLADIESIRRQLPVNQHRRL